LRKSTDEDIQRISCLLLYLHKNIEKELKTRESSVSPIRQGSTPNTTAPGPMTATAKLLTLQDKLKAGVLNKLHATTTTPLDDLENRLDEELT